LSFIENLMKVENYFSKNYYYYNHHDLFVIGFIALLRNKIKMILHERYCVIKNVPIVN